VSDRKDRFPTAGWLEGAAPSAHVVMSSRARYARNVAEFPFSPHAKSEDLGHILTAIASAASKSQALGDFERRILHEVEPEERAFLKETRLISQEMERGAFGRAVLLSPDRKCSVMINEEDHLRMQCIEPGLQLEKAVARLDSIERALAESLAFAANQRYGYLTACPTNVGTGLRVSAMLHLPALSIIREVESLLSGLGPRGMTVRGFNGENSEFLGDFFQVSNEVTLGKTSETIVRDLAGIIHNVVVKEEETRAALFREKGSVVEDAIWRSWAILAYARRVSSKEAMTLLSRLRLGIDRSYFPGLTHDGLNRLFVEIQPAHLARLSGEERLPDDVGIRDELRAKYLRDRLKDEGPK
jgi:protein arginine kinase